VKNNQPSCVIADSPNFLFDTEVYSVIRGLNAKQRLALAEKFANWSEQIAASARQMDPSISDAPMPSTMPKGFILINMSEGKKKRLAEMAKEAKLELRTVLKNALFGATQMLKEDIKLMRLMGVTRWELSQKAGLFFRSENN
jgi:hypothetical protein